MTLWLLAVCAFAFFAVRNPAALRCACCSGGALCEGCSRVWRAHLQGVDPSASDYCRGCDDADFSCVHDWRSLGSES